MTTWTLAPSLGWILGAAIALLMIAVAIAGPLAYQHDKHTSDATWLTVIRRSCIAILLAIISLTPSQIRQVTNRAVNATDVFIAVDVTGSMAVNDAHYGSESGITRLDAAKRAVGDIVQTYPNASFAAMHFGSSANLDLPLTPDTRAVNNWASNLTTEPTSLSAGSSLDAPIAPLTLSLKDRKEQHPNNAILLYIITDGEQTSNKSRQSFSALRAYVDDAYTVGVGSAEGGKVPKIDVDPSKNHVQNHGWVKDPQTGKPGISKMDETQLKTIADELSGHYINTAGAQTITNNPSSEASHRYQVRANNSKQERVVPMVWPLVFILLGLLIWEMVDWIYTTRRLL